MQGWQSLSRFLSGRPVQPARGTVVPMLGIIRESLNLSYLAQAGLLDWQLAFFVNILELKLLSVFAI
jgi:hypothetical protein